MDIRALQADTITEHDAAELARLQTLVNPRRLRTDPPVSPALAGNGLLPSVATFAFTYFGLFDGPTMVGLAESFGAINAENADVCEVGIWIDPDHLGRGLHRSLFGHVDNFERERGRTRYWGWGDLADAPTRSFWEDELGYTLAYDERISRCELDQVDAAMIEQWINRAQDRASGYHLMRAVSPFTEEQLNHYATALEGMNDAPVDDLVHEPEKFDADRARQVERLHTASNSEYRAVFAIETATNALAGFTAVRIPLDEPAFSKQGDTVTIDAHRNRGIGRWIKADMLNWLKQDRPDVACLDTGNAESNRAMLAINEAMGFRDVLHHGVWHKPDGKQAG